VGISEAFSNETHLGVVLPRDAEAIKHSQHGC
jgi:hypothetical protein